MTQQTWQDLPREIQEEMLNEQKRQGNKRNLGVFEKDIISCKSEGGFEWYEHKTLSSDDWNEILHKGNFAPFYEKFPKKEPETIAWDEPVEMLAWDDEIHPTERFICGKFLGHFIEKRKNSYFVSWKYAKPIIPTINWDEFKEGDVVEVEEEDDPFKFVGYCISQDFKHIYISPSNYSKTAATFKKSNIKSIRKLK